jgi:hypothetical protein
VLTLSLTQPSQVLLRQSNSRPHGKQPVSKKKEEGVEEKERFGLCVNLENLFNPKKRDSGMRLM